MTKENLFVEGSCSEVGTGAQLVIRNGMPVNCSRWRRETCTDKLGRAAGGEQLGVRCDIVKPEPVVTA